MLPKKPAKSQKVKKTEDSKSKITTKEVFFVL